MCNQVHVHGSPEVCDIRKAPVGRVEPTPRAIRSPLQGRCTSACEESDPHSLKASLICTPWIEFERDVTPLSLEPIFSTPEEAITGLRRNLRALEDHRRPTSITTPQRTNPFYIQSQFPRLRK